MYFCYLKTTILVLPSEIYLNRSFRNHHFLHVIDELVRPCRLDFDTTSEASSWKTALEEAITGVHGDDLVRYQHVEVIGFVFFVFCFLVLSLCHFKEEKHFMDMENKIEDFELSGYGFYWLFYVFLVLSLYHFKDEKHLMDMENKIEDFGLRGYGFLLVFFGFFVIVSFQRRKTLYGYGK